MLEQNLHSSRATDRGITLAPSKNGAPVAFPEGTQARFVFSDGHVLKMNEDNEEL